MGLLTDPRQRRRFVLIISRYNNRLCALFYISGLLWFLGLAYVSLNAETYFSENALLPGLVEGDFYAESDVKLYKNEMKQEMDKNKRLLSREWLFSKFQEIGLEVHVQNYTVKYPLQLLGEQSVPGQNVYAILRAPRASSTEAVVLSAPVRSQSMISKSLTDTSGGISLMLALTKFFKKQTYWSKDIIFLFTQHEHIGMQAWLDGYHQVQSSEYIFPGTVWGRSGSIQAALNLEIPPEKVAYYNIKIEGLNGQLPNLDLVNLVVRLCRREGAAIRLHNQFDYHDSESFDGFKHSLLTMLRMMKTQASGSPSGNHGLFHRYHIEAVTIQGMGRVPGHKNFGLMVTGRIVEGIFRSLNNLLERFHQSFFFYIMPATNRYISIGLYMPPFSLMAAAGLIKAIAMWIGPEKSSEEENGNGKKDQAEEKTTIKRETETDTDHAKVKKEDEEEETAKSACMQSPDEDDDDGDYDEDDDIKDDVEEEEEVDEDEDDDDDDDDGIVTGNNREKTEGATKSRDILSIIPVLLLSYLMGLMTYYSPEIFSRQTRQLQIQTDEAVTYGLLALFCACLFFPRFISKKTSELDTGFQVDWPLLKCVALIFQAVILFSIALMNISLAFFLAAAMVPVSTMVHPVSNKLLRCLQSLLLLLVSPPVLVYLGSVITVLDEQWPRSSFDLLTNAWNLMRDTTLLSILDYSLLSCWTYPVFCFAIYPNWIMLWGVSRMRMEGLLS